MANLDPLIRVRKHIVEQKQKALAALYKRAEDLKAERDALEAQLVIELEKSKDMDAELLRYFALYKEKVINQIEAIDQKRQKLENQILLAQEDMRAAYAEQKKIQIIQERRQKEQRAALDKKDADELDEIAIETFRRGEGD